MKISKPFTSEELALIKGSYSIVARTNKTSSAYVSQIANGKRDTKTLLAERVLNSLKELVDLLQKQTNKSE